MLTLLSPAKKMNLDPVERSLPFTDPELAKDVRELAKIAKQQSANDLKKLMHISDKLAELNAERFKVFNLDGKSNSAKAAGLAFDGDVYWGLEAKSLSDDDLQFAQQHVRILSGLYGVLRPLDMIQPYRLEMGTRLATKRGKSLYAFWGSIIAQTLNEHMADHADGSILNLASNEYFKAVDKKTLGRRVVEAKFLNIKDGKARNLMYYAKYGRGLMTRWVVQNRIDRVDDLRGFNLENYAIDEGMSGDDLLVFTREQPPTKK